MLYNDGCIVYSRCARKEFSIIAYDKCETRTDRYISLLLLSIHFKSTITLITAFIGSVRIMFRHLYHRIYTRSASPFKNWNNKTRTENFESLWKGRKKNEGNDYRNKKINK